MLRKKLAILALASAPLVAMAQPHGGPPRLDMDRLAIILELDSYQQSEVERILESQRESMRARFAEQDERPSREEMRAARESSRAQLLSRLQSVLTAGQIEKFEALTDRPRRGRGPRVRDGELE